MTVIYFLGILSCESAFVPQLSSHTGNVAFPTFHLHLYPHVQFLNTCASACCAILTPAHETPYGYQEAVPRRHLTPSPSLDARPLTDDSALSLSLHPVSFPRLLARLHSQTSVGRVRVRSRTSCTRTLRRCTLDTRRIIPGRLI